MQFQGLLRRYCKASRTRRGRKIIGRLNAAYFGDISEEYFFPYRLGQRFIPSKVVIR